MDIVKVAPCKGDITSGARSPSWQERGPQGSLTVMSVTGQDSSDLLVPPNWP